MHLTGTVVSGLREAAGYVAKYDLLFKQALGFHAFPGTLNVRVPAPPALANPTIVHPPGLSKVSCYPATVRANGSALRGAIVIPEKTRHPENILEVIAAMDLRRALHLSDGDAVELEA